MASDFLDISTDALHLNGLLYLNNNSGTQGQIVGRGPSGPIYVNVSFSGSTGIKTYDLSTSNTTLAYNFGGNNMCFGGIILPTNDTNVTGMNFYVTQTGATGNVQAAVYEVNASNLNQANLITFSGIQSMTFVGGRNMISLNSATLIGGNKYYAVIQFLNNASSIAARSGVGYATSTAAPNLNFKFSNVTQSFGSIPILNVSDYTSQICPYLQLF